MKAVGMRSFCVTSLPAEMLFRYILLLFAKEYLTLERMWFMHSFSGPSNIGHISSEYSTFRVCVFRLYCWL